MGEVKVKVRMLSRSVGGEKSDAFRNHEMPPTS